MTGWQLAMKNLWRRPARTLLTAIAVAIGIAAVVSLTAISWGFEASWQHANDARGTDLIVTRASSENTMPAPFAAAALQAQLAAMPHVSQVAGLLSEMLSVDDAPPLFVFGWERNSFLWDHLHLLKGRWPIDDSEHGVLLGELAAELTGKHIGDSMHIESDDYQVIGIYQSSALVENGALLMTLKQAQRLNEMPGKVNVLNIKLDDPVTQIKLADIRAKVRATMPGYVALTSGQLVQQNAVVRISKAMSGATILIAGLVGALGVFNTMLMSISERTREIGVLLAVGWHRRRVIRLVLTESIIVTALGGLLGVLLGVFGVFLLEHVELLRGKIDGVITLPLVLAALGLAVLLGALGGLYPALRASRLSPTVALRYE